MTTVSDTGGAEGSVLPPPTAGPLEVGYYTPTTAFLSTSEHVAVMDQDGRVVALVDPADDPQSLVDAHRFKAVVALHSACLAALAEVKGSGSPAERALESHLRARGHFLGGRRR